MRSDDSVIGRKLFVNGEFDFHKFAVVMDLLERKEVKTLYDIGANVGSICIPAVLRGYATRAVAFEPDPTNFALLDLNCRWNGISEAVLRFNAALGASEGVAGLLVPEDKNFGDIRVLESEDELLNGGPIALLRPFDQFGFELDASQDLLWMDVQGRELGVLAGASSATSRGVPLVMEFWPFELCKFGSVERLLELVPAYRSFFNLADPAMSRLPLSELRNLWATHEPHEGSVTDILLLP